MYKWLLKISLVILLLVPLDSLAQKNKGQNPKKAAKEQIKKREQDEKESAKALERAKKRHVKIQSRQTRDSMKRNKKRSKKQRENKDNIFRRIFG